MKKKFTRDISVNTLQLLINQVCGLVIFYVLSVFLDKKDFGEINWTLAVMLTLFGILACGIDQVVIKKIASGEDESSILSTYIFHVLFTGLTTYLILFAGRFFFPSFFAQHQLLLLIGIGKLMIFFSTPFKQLATGLEKFRPLLYMAVCSNIVRSLFLLLFVFLNHLNIQTVIIVFIAGDVCELLLSLFITNRILKIPVALQVNKGRYFALLKEAAPQLGVAVFTAIMARFDWIFLGIFTSNVIVANYSFAYKLFEVATLPMLVIAPMLIPRFTKIFHPDANGLDHTKKADLFILLRVEMIVASFIALIVNILWIPVIDLLTSGKYGAVNKYSILFLSAAMPFLYYNNFLWTLNFAKGRLRMIFFIFLLSFLVNLAGAVILIPLFQAEGAALACLLAIVCQSLAYLWKTQLGGLRLNSLSLLISPACAWAAGLCSFFLFQNTLLQLFSACCLFFLFLFLTRQARIADINVIKRITGF